MVEVELKLKVTVWEKVLWSVGVFINSSFSSVGIWGLLYKMLRLNVAKNSTLSRNKGSWLHLNVTFYTAGPRRTILR